jgi:glycosyltransferase involved in cell wall biosynthesis
MINNNSTIAISAVIPVYNDAVSLEKAIPAAMQHLEQICSSFELIIAEEASTDGSYEIAREWADRDIRIQILHKDKRQGRGLALTRAALYSSGEIFCYFDVDLATDLKHLQELILSIRKGNDIAIGSRLLTESCINRSLNREVKSRGYNLLVRLFLGGKVRDHQCGFKAFNRVRLLQLLPDIRDTHWFWDTELLILAQRHAYRVDEIPVTWQEGSGTTVKKSDIIQMGRSILSLWFRSVKDQIFQKKTREKSLNDRKVRQIMP